MPEFSELSDSTKKVIFFSKIKSSMEEIAETTYDLVSFNVAVISKLSEFNEDEVNMIRFYLKFLEIFTQITKYDGFLGLLSDIEKYKDEHCEHRWSTELFEGDDEDHPIACQICIFCNTTKGEKSVYLKKKTEKEEDEGNKEVEKDETTEDKPSDEGDNKDSDTNKKNVKQTKKVTKEKVEKVEKVKKEPVEKVKKEKVEKVKKEPVAKVEKVKKEKVEKVKEENPVKKGRKSKVVVEEVPETEAEAEAETA